MNPARVVVIGAVLLGGCAREPPSVARTISSSSDCRGCTIQVEPLATLQLPSDSLSFGLETSVVRLANENFLTTHFEETAIPALFDSAGRFIKLIAREGQGPGELERDQTHPILVGPGDSVWVVANDRTHVLTTDMRFVRRDERVRDEPILLAPDGKRLVVGWGYAGNRPPYPLHILDERGAVVRSFGSDTAITDVPGVRRGNVKVRRKFALGGANTFWAYWGDPFLLEQYDFEGNLLARGAHAVDGWYKEETERYQAAGVATTGLGIWLIQESKEQHLLWLVYWVRNASYAKGTPIVMTTWSKQFDVVIEALDTRTFHVLATTRIPGTVAMRTENALDMLSVVQSIDDVFHTYRVNRLRLVRPR